MIFGFSVKYPAMGADHPLPTRQLYLNCATHTPHNSWRSLISGGCRTSMEHSTTTGPEVQDAPSLPVFRRELKTVLFQSSFPAD